MTTGRLQRRLGALEAERANRLGQVHRVFVPEELSGSEREAGSRSTGVPAAE